MRKKITLYFLSFICIIFCDLRHSFGATAPFDSSKKIRYEYYPADTTGAQKPPVVVVVPGFTQHNGSADFVLLKNLIMNQGFAYLVMNPPQHGEDYDWTPIYRWGEQEAIHLNSLTDHLDIWQHHSELHLLGFSIGAKIVLNFAALSEKRDRVASVIAVATPYRVGDINFRVSGSFKRPIESLFAIWNSFKRACLRVPYMAAAGLPIALFKNSANPANNIPNINAPTLLIHGSNDWLTKSYHSQKLYREAPEKTPITFIALNTTIHAEDMLSRDSDELRDAFLSLMISWFKNIQSFPENGGKTDLKNWLATKIATPAISQHIYDKDKITLMSSPTLLKAGDMIWLSAADDNHSFITINQSIALKKSLTVGTFVSSTLTTNTNSWLRKFRLGLAVRHDNYNKTDSPETYLSFYHQIGTFFWLRRLTFVQGFASDFNRRLLSADLAFLLIDFELTYGRFFPNRNDLQLAFNCPLISNASGSYFLGLTYDRFLSEEKVIPEKEYLGFYLTLGPDIKIWESRLRVNLQYSQDGLFLGINNRVWRMGFGVNVYEQ